MSPARHHPLWLATAVVLVTMAACGGEPAASHDPESHEAASSAESPPAEPAAPSGATSPAQGGQPAAAPAPEKALPPATAAAANDDHPETAEPHGDHTPYKGGWVFMSGDLHYEVVMDRTGKYEIYLTDEVRKELPASTVESATVTVRRADGDVEVIVLEPDAKGEGWHGQGRPVEDPNAVARIGYEYQGSRHFIDLVFPDPEP